MAQRLLIANGYRSLRRSVLAAGALLLAWGLITQPQRGPVPVARDGGVAAPETSVATQPVSHPAGAGGFDARTPAPVRHGGFMDALARGDHAAAVELYSASYDRSSAAAAEAGREMLLQHASRLLHSHDPASATTLLQAYVAVFYRDVDAHLMLAQSYRDRGELWPAILAFQAAYQHAHRPGVRRLLSGQLNWTVNLYVQRLREQQRNAEVVALYQELTRAQPENPHYFVALAQAYLARQDRAAALSALDYVVDDADVGERVRTMIGDLLGAPEASG